MIRRYDIDTGYYGGVDANFCLACMEVHPIQRVAVTEENIFKGKRVEYQAIYEYCPNTDAYTATDEMIDLNDTSLKDAYKRNGGEWIYWKDHEAEVACLKELNQELVMYNMSIINERFNRAMLEVVPGGSEFYDDPERCVAFIKQKDQAKTRRIEKLLKENTLLKELNQEMMDALEHIAEYWNGGSESAVDAIEHAIKTAQEVLAKAEEGKSSVNL